jgi:hypothetical protein
MKKLIILISILLIPISAFSTDWNYVGKLGDRGYQSKIQCLDSNNCFAINYFLDTLRVFHSADQGRTWQLRHSSLGSENEIPPEVYNPQDISIPDTNHIFISYYDRLVLKKSTDGGRSFTNIPIKDSLSPAWNIVMYDSLFGFTTFGKEIYITNDGWKTWEIKFNDISPAFIFPYFENKEEIKYLSFANDNYTFTKYNFKTNQVNDLFYFYKNISTISEHRYSLQSLTKVNENLLFGAGSIRNGVGDQSRDMIFRTKDGGNTWEIVHDMEKKWIFGLQNISCYDENNCTAVGQWGKVIMTKDGGDTWVYDKEGDTPFKRGNESIYGPPVMQVAWAGKTPIVITLDSHVYRYEGNFFDLQEPVLVLDKPEFFDGDLCNETKKATVNRIYLGCMEVENAKEYNYVLSEDSNFQNILLDTTLADSYYKLSDNYICEYGKKYYYKIRAKRDSITSKWSETNCFITLLDSIVETLEPKCGETITNNEILLKWKKIDKYNKYKVSIYKGIFGLMVSPTLVVLDTVVSDEYSFIPPIDTVYTWRVQAITDISESYILSNCLLFKIGGTSVEDTQPINTSIFPNPSSEKISLDLGGMAVADLAVYDILGNEIMSIPNYTNKSEIDISTLSIGTYTIQIQTKTGSISQRLLVNR